MKLNNANPLVLLFLFLMLGVVTAQQNNSALNVTNNTAFAELKAKAEKGDADAQLKLGTIYSGGDGVDKNPVEAAKWYREAAEKGNSWAQFNLAFCYAQGWGVATNFEEADKWFRKTAETCTDTGLEVILATLFQDDGGFLEQSGFNGRPDKDVVVAAKLYLRAAQQGSGEAQLSLAQMYEAGEGVNQDFIEAYKWFNIAATSPDRMDWRKAGFSGERLNFLKQNLPPVAERAKTARDQLAQQMTPDQIAVAQALSREFKPQTESNSNNSNSSENPTASGTGFFITDDGYLISNFHVVKDAARVQLRTGAGLIPAKVVRTDAANDIALLKADGRFAPLPIAASRNAALGDSVFTLGFPDPTLQGFAPKLAKGEIASLSGAADDARYFQVSVPVQPGNSGGALVDEHGNVIGIVSAKLDASIALAASGALPENVNYAVKSSFLLSFLESVPDVDAKLKPANTADEKFSDAVKQAQGATVLVLVY